MRTRYRVITKLPNSHNWYIQREVFMEEEKAQSWAKAFVDTGILVPGEQWAIAKEEVA